MRVWGDPQLTSAGHVQVGPVLLNKGGGAVSLSRSRPAAFQRRRPAGNRHAAAHAGGHGRAECLGSLPLPHLHTKLSLTDRPQAPFARPLPATAGKSALWACYCSLTLPGGSGGPLPLPVVPWQPGCTARARPPLPLPGSRVRAFLTALVAPVPPCRLWRRLGGAHDTWLRGCGQPRAGGVWGQPSLPTLFVSAGSPELTPTRTLRRRRWKRASLRTNSLTWVHCIALSARSVSAPLAPPPPPCRAAPLSLQPWCRRPVWPWLRSRSTEPSTCCSRSTARSRSRCCRAAVPSASPPAAVRGRQMCCMLCYSCPATSIACRAVAALPRTAHTPDSLLLPPLIITPPPAPLPAAHAPAHHHRLAALQPSAPGGQQGSTGQPAPDQVNGPPACRMARLLVEWPACLLNGLPAC